MKTRPLVLLLLALYVFSPTIFDWVIEPNGAWYRPYILWMAVIAIAYFVQSRRANHDA